MTTKEQVTVDVEPRPAHHIYPTEPGLAGFSPAFVLTTPDSVVYALCGAARLHSLFYSKPNKANYLLRLSEL